MHTRRNENYTLDIVMELLCQTHEAALAEYDSQGHTALTYVLSQSVFDKLHPTIHSLLDPAVYMIPLINEHTKHLPFKPFSGELKKPIRFLIDGADRIGVQKILALGVDADGDDLTYAKQKFFGGIACDIERFLANPANFRQEYLNQTQILRKSSSALSVHGILARSRSSSTTSSESLSRQESGSHLAQDNLTPGSSPTIVTLASQLRL